MAAVAMLMPVAGFDGHPVSRPAFTDERERTMGATYWARWVVSSQAADLPGLILPRLLEQGYELLSHDTDRQVFDRGGVLKKIAWSLNGGNWGEAPVDLTVTYTCLGARTIVNFYWKLAVRPLPVSPKEQAAFEAQLQTQLSHVISQVSEQLLGEPAEPATSFAHEGASLQAYWKHAQGGSDALWQQDAATATCLRHSRTSLESATVQIDGPTRCDACHGPAVPLPGTKNRYFCLTCRHHVSCQPAA